MADLPLIPWDEVPEGQYVWCRQKGHDAVDWQRWRRRHDDLVTPGGTWIKPDLYEFTPAEQQPGEWAAQVAMLDAVLKAGGINDLPFLTGMVQAALEDNKHLRDGLAALEQDLRERGYTFDWIADRLAALREGR